MKDPKDEFFKAKRQAIGIVDNIQIAWKQDMDELNKTKHIPDGELEFKRKLTEIVTNELEKVRSAIRNNVLYKTENDY